ncbi:MAG: hypothetical protein WB610_13195 [Rhodomicrobium sp.]|jgi:hypothetical protein
MDWLLHQPLAGSGFLVYAEGLDLRMHEDVDDGGKPVLPVMTGDDGNTLDLALVILDEQDMFFERLAVFPAMQGPGVNKEADLPLLADEFVDLRRDRGEINRPSTLLAV